MSDEGALGRIEAKIDSLNNSVIKITYAILALLGGVIGVEFLPKSPIDWIGATSHAVFLIIIFSALFCTMLEIRSIRNNGVKKISFKKSSKKE